MLPFVLMTTLSYFCGSIPFGLILGKAIKGIDLRAYGSGNIGATNAWRVLGPRWGLLCLILDALKGLVPVAVLPQLFFNTDNPLLIHATIVAAIATIVGHMYPCWLGFRGGKGVATSLGVLVIVSPWGVLVAVSLFVLTLAVFRLVSLSSIIAAVGFGAYELLVRLQPNPFSELHWSAGLFAVLIPTLIVIRHRSNIRRLIQGTEPRLTRRAATVPDESPAVNQSDATS